MSAQPLISIIIPSFNKGDKIESLLLSIKEQEYTNFQIIIIDGGSTDQTETVIKKFGPLIYYRVSEKDNGIFDAMNKGIAKAKGDWLFFIGCDDKLHDRQVLSSIFGNKELGSEKIIYGKIYNNHLKQTAGEEIKDKADLLTSNLWHQAIFYHKDVFERTGMYETKYKIAGDSVFNKTLYCNYDLKWKFVDRVITDFDGSGISSFAQDKVYHADEKKLFSKWFEGISKKKIYDGLQHHLYNEIRSGNLFTAFKEYCSIIWNTRSFFPYTRHAFYYLKQRRANKKHSTSR